MAIIFDENYVSRNSETIWRVLENEVFIIEQDANKIRLFNKLGSFLWQLFDGKKTIHQVVSLVCDRFDVAEEVARADTMEFVETLLSQNLIKLKDVPSEE